MVMGTCPRPVRGRASMREPMYPRAPQQAPPLERTNSQGLKGCGVGVTTVVSVGPAARTPTPPHAPNPLTCDAGERASHGRQTFGGHVWDQRNPNATRPMRWTGERRAMALNPHHLSASRDLAGSLSFLEGTAGREVMNIHIYGAEDHTAAEPAMQSAMQSVMPSAMQSVMAPAMFNHGDVFPTGHAPLAYSSAMFNRGHMFPTSHAPLAYSPAMRVDFLAIACEWIF